MKLFHSMRKRIHSSEKLQGSSSRSSSTSSLASSNSAAAAAGGGGGGCTSSGSSSGRSPASTAAAAGGSGSSGSNSTSSFASLGAAAAAGGGGGTIAAGGGAAAGGELAAAGRAAAGAGGAGIAAAGGGAAAGVAGVGTPLPHSPAGAAAALFLASGAARENSSSSLVDAGGAGRTAGTGAATGAGAAVAAAGTGGAAATERVGAAGSLYGGEDSSSSGKAAAAGGSSAAASLAFLFQKEGSGSLSSQKYLHCDSTKLAKVRQQQAQGGVAYPPGRGTTAPYFGGTGIPNFEELPSLLEAPQTERAELFKKKLLACTCVFDFNDVHAHLKEKEAKRQTLLEIVEYVNNSRHCFTDQNLPDVVYMVSANIFRPLPPAHASSFVGDAEEEEPALENAWPHLQIVYEFFLRFIVSNEVNPKVARKYIDQQFVLRLLELFASEDPRERDYLKTILHRIYGKIMALRLFIRRSIQQVFYRFIYEDECSNGISELLEILGSVINGFALPLKEEHKLFLERVLIPLHRARSLTPFHQQLTYCMQQYVTKDSRLAGPILLGLLRFWPVTNAPKVVLFLSELEHILVGTQLQEFQSVMQPLFRRLAECIQSPHFQVAERVLFLWNNEHIVKLINQNRQVIFPIVIAALFKNSQYHWNSTVHTLTYNVSKLLAEADAALFDDCSNRHIAEEERRKGGEEERERKWEELRAAYEALEETEAEDLDWIRHSDEFLVS